MAPVKAESTWEMGYGHNVLAEFFVLKGTCSFRIFEWSFHSRPILQFISLMFPATKKSE